MPIKKIGKFDLVKEMKISTRNMLSKFLSEEELSEVIIEINKTTSVQSISAPDIILEKIRSNFPQQNK